MTKQQKNDKSILNRIPYFSLFCFLAIFYWSVTISLWHLLYLVVLPFTFKKTKISVWLILIIISIIIYFICLVIFNPTFSLIFYINKLINSHNGNFLANSISKFIDVNYPNEIGTFSNLLLLNIKSKKIIVFYKQTINLGITWLFCAGAFHLSLITKSIKTIFKKHLNIGLILNIIICSFYTVILKFSYGCIRVLLTLIFTKFFKKYKIFSFEKLGFVGLCICLFNPKCFNSYGFILSIICCITAYSVYKFEIKNKIVVSILCNFLISLAIVPLLFDMNFKISLFTFINTFLYSYILTFYFIYFWIFIWIIQMNNIHLFLIHLMYYLIGNFSFINIFIYSNKWSICIKFIYYSLLIILIKISHFIVNKYKI